MEETFGQCYTLDNLQAVGQIEMEGNCMLDSRKSGRFIAEKRKSLGMTQQQLADKISVSFQSISKYENGSVYPSIEVLYDLAMCLKVTVDEILTGVEREQDSLSYSKAGVDISYTDTIKQEMAKYLQTENPRVLNGLGAFASLDDIDFPKLEHPLLVLKSEEPGSKQKLAMEYGYTEYICYDMINHLVNDIYFDCKYCRNCGSEECHRWLKN